MPHPQFTLRSLLVAMLVVAAYFAGMAVQKRLDKGETVIMRIHLSGGPSAKGRGEVITLGDGTSWYRMPD